MPMLTERDARFDKILDTNLLKKQEIRIIGCGAVGRQLALQLGAMGVGTIHLHDHDEVGIENAGTQGWALGRIGMKKVDVLANEIARNNPDVKVHTYPYKVDAEYVAANHGPDVIFGGDTCVFLCVDSLDVRRDCIRLVAECELSDIYPVFDSRCGLESIEVYEFHNLTEFEEVTASDSEANRADCTTRQTIYTAYLASGLLCQLYAHHLRQDDDRPRRLEFHGSCLTLRHT